ncbi:hypothetical protein [Skermanella pratensis]|uniref:hypothetical protein n=1 Tax=Skermanella pratensis TaxID=2233999 RepID=UPI0017881D83|nr:hypothetical protein [Skermanella pratensis]
MKTFFPIRHIDVAATGNVNGSGACCRVVFGMDRGGKAPGRLNPAFLHGSDGFAGVARAKSELPDQVRASGLVSS